MQRSITRLAGLAFILGAAGCTLLQPQNGLQLASQSAGVTDTLQTIEFSGSGRWYQFGQAPNPDLPWPPFDVKTYVADINFAAASARVQISRLQVIEPGRNRPAPVEQRVDQYIKGNVAWNVATTANASPSVTAQPAAVEERAAEIWATPQGFLKAALANNATVEELDKKTKVSFTLGGKYRFTGIINANNQLENIKTCIDNPVLGDTVVETQFSNYRDFGGIQFPEHIVRNQGGFPVLDINVATVKTNPGFDVAVPQEATQPPAVVVTANKLAEGVYYLTGSSHHSVAIEQTDHVVVVEAPLNEERSLAVIAKVQEIIPNKPIRFLINTHAHFDHSGGLRTFANMGARIVTLTANQAYYQKVWSGSRTLNPDALAKSHNPVAFDSFNQKYSLTDGKRPIEIISIANNSHNDNFVMVYLPKEKILIEADAFNPPAANAPLPTTVNPYSANLYENIQKLKLDVKQIAGLHGRVASLDELKAYIGVKK